MEYCDWRSVSCLFVGKNLKIIIFTAYELVLQSCSSILAKTSFPTSEIANIRLNDQRQYHMISVDYRQISIVSNEWKFVNLPLCCTQTTRRLREG